MLGSLTSLTGGGGLQNSSSAASSTGAQDVSIGFQGGSVGAPAGGLENINWTMVLVVGAVLYVAIKK